MLRAGIGVILGVVIVVLLQVMQIHDEKIANDAFRRHVRVTSSNNTVTPLTDAYKVNKTYSEDLGIQFKGFEPYTEEFEPIFQSVYGAGDIERYHLEKKKLRKLMQVFVMLKFAGDSNGKISFKNSF